MSIADLDGSRAVLATAAQDFAGAISLLKVSCLIMIYESIVGKDKWVSDEVAQVVSVVASMMSVLQNASCCKRGA